MNSKTEKPRGLNAASLNNFDCVSNANHSTKAPPTIQPKFTIDDVDNHLARFRYAGRVTKRVRMIAWVHLCSTSGFSVTRFDALHVGCSCWNTTASEIGTKSGLLLERCPTTRRTRFSDSTSVSEYWFPDSEIQRVVDCLGGYRQEAA